MKSDKVIQIVYDIPCMWNLNYDTNKLIYETETDPQTWRTDLRFLRWGRNGVGVWGQRMQTVICRMHKQQGRTVEHRELYSVIKLAHYLKKKTINDYKTRVLK